jgi:DNA polymerase III delta prime subunit
MEYKEENENENDLGSTKLNIHQNIKKKLKYFYDIHKIPNILFNGVSGCGKSNIINEFIDMIYDNDREKIISYVMFVNCAYGKGIKFIRDELKLFAKTHINSDGGNIFKSIVLFNGDKLTMDAQSALRRCIELFCHNTRFFISVEDKNKLLKPILSRFCEIYVPETNIGNLYKYNINKNFNISNIKSERLSQLKNIINEINFDEINEIELINLITYIYENGYSGLDIIELIENNYIIQNNRKYDILMLFNKIKKEVRNEKIILFSLINFSFLDSRINLENINFM